MIPLTSRRTLLKGIPASLAALAVSSPFWSRLIQRAAAQESSQQRLLVWYVPDGLVPEWFWGASPGTLSIRADRTNDLSGNSFNTAVPSGDRPTFVQQPISEYAGRSLLINGLSNPGEADHVFATQSCLTGEAVKKGAPGKSPSLDVLMAEANLTDNHVEPVFRTGAYGGTISYTGTRDLCRPRNNGDKWIEPSWQPVADARRLLDAVSGVTTEPDSDAAHNKASRLAALGSVRTHVQTLRCASGTLAGTRLEAYIEEVARLEQLENEVRAVTPFVPTLNPDDPDVQAAQNDVAGYPDMAPFLRELAVTALALDYSPAVTLQWAASGRNRISGNKLTDYRYDFLPNLEYPGAGEHGLAHPENGAFIDAGHNISAAVSTRDRVRIRRWYFEQMKMVLDRLSSIPDGSGTLFDNTSVLYVSEFGGPNANSVAAQHSTRNLPYMLVAGAATPFQTGKYMEVSRTHGDYLLTLAKGFGSQETQMGVGTSTIDGILR